MPIIGQTVTVATPIPGLTRAMTTNSTSTVFGSIINQAARPSTIDGTTAVFDPSQDRVVDNNHTVIYPIGTGDDNATLHMNLWGWRRFIESPDANTEIWKPIFIGLFSMTLSTSIGVAGTPQLATERDVDTIIASNNNSLIVVNVHSPTDNTPGFILLDTIGFRFLQAEWDIDAGAGVDSDDANLLFGSF